MQAYLQVNPATAVPALFTPQVANACLVHKLGRCVQLVKLHCELHCAVLGGQYGSAAGGGGGEGVAGAGRGINRVLQLWDYEGSMGRQVCSRPCKFCCCPGAADGAALLLGGVHCQQV